MCCRDEAGAFFGIRCDELDQIGFIGDLALDFIKHFVHHLL
jgi:hypothetical protein